MTVPATTRRAGPFTGNGVTTSFPFTFKTFDTEDLAVTLTDTDALESTLVLDSDYSVTLNGDQDSSPGGSITYPISGTPLAAAEKLTVIGAVDYDQTADLPTGGSFSPIVIENALDRATLQIQQLAEQAGRALTVAPAYSAVDNVLPAPEASKIIGWDEAASALVNYSPSDFATVVVNGTSYTDVFSGTGARTAFALTANPGSVNALDIAISGVSQVNGVDFTVSGSTLTFTSAPAAATGNICVRYVAAVPVGTANAQDVTFLPAGTGALSTTAQAKLRERVSVFDYMSAAQIADTQSGSAPTLDSAAAWSAAWAAVKESGGTLLVPPGGYLLNSQVSFDIKLTLPRVYRVEGYGATIYNGAAVTGHALRVVGGFNNFGVEIEGLAFNHRGNTTANGCVQLVGAANAYIGRVAVEVHNAKAGYSVVQVDNDSYWSTIDRLTIRQRSGGDGSLADYGVQLIGQANATKVLNCSIGAVTHGIHMTALAGCDISLNNFEGATNCVTIDCSGGNMPSGVHIALNRVESATTFLNISGALAADASCPPVLRDNYLTVGSVTNYLVNPNNQYVFSSESSYFGVGPRNVMGGPGDYRVITEGSGKNLVLGNLSGSSNYDQAHLSFGGYHLWVDANTSMPFMKANAVAPASAQDGRMCGTITGTATFGGGTTVVVTHGYTMASAAYRVMLGPTTNRTFWVTGRTATQFTINAAAGNTDTVDWMMAP